MADLTRAEIEAMSTCVWLYGAVGPAKAQQAITQLLRQLDDMTSRADAAAGKMRERCAAFCKENEVGLSARDGYVIAARHELSGGTHPGMKYSEALSALPLHEEPKP